MSIIDFKMEWVNYDMNITHKERTNRAYEELKDSLPFHVGDKVKVVIDPNYPNKEVINALNNKIFTIIEPELTFDTESPIAYILNTGINITLFYARNLIKIED